MGVGSMIGFTIDGKGFDPTRTDIGARLGSIEEWTVRNTSSMDHPFHLHVWPFQIVDGPRTSVWKDTVNVPAGGEVRIRIPFAGFAGRTVYHCHILDHEDLGMMGVIDVAP
jgi:FtsP/CotA-like multicopper oxidase with cupredoxin domain